MNTLAVLTRDRIEVVLAKLASPWTISSSAPLGATTGRQGMDGPVGAWLDFYGIVRGTEPSSSTEPAAKSAGTGSPGAERPGGETPGGKPSGSEPIIAIDYEAHPDMAQHQLELLLERIGAKYPLEAMLVIHRIGRVPVGEASLLVRVLSGHREEALRACAEFIDELKKWIPIWKHPISA